MLKLQYDSFGMLAANAYLITDEDSGESALIDCPKYTRAMKELIADANVKYVLLTHAHFDHITGCSKMLNDVKCKCYVSAYDSFMITDAKANLSASFYQRCEPFPFETFDDEHSDFHLGSVPIHIISTPGHTPGSVAYLIGNYLFTGDTVNASSMGRTDFPFGDELALRKSIKTISSFHDEIMICPGHDERITLGELKNKNPYFMV